MCIHVYIYIYIYIYIHTYIHTYMYREREMCPCATLGVWWHAMAAPYPFRWYGTGRGARYGTEYAQKSVMFRVTVSCLKKEHKVLWNSKWLKRSNALIQDTYSLSQKDFITSLAYLVSKRLAFVSMCSYCVIYLINVQMRVTKPNVSPVTETRDLLVACRQHVCWSK